MQFILIQTHFFIYSTVIRHATKVRAKTLCFVSAMKDGGKSEGRCEMFRQKRFGLREAHTH